MSSRILHSCLLAILGISAFAVAAIGVYMAQPWGDNYAYQDASGFRSFFLMLLFAVTPYLALGLCARFFARSDGASRLFMIGAALIGVGGVAAYADAAFVHIDAQGGLVFIFLPVVQLVAAFVLVVASALWLWLAKSRGAAR